MRPHHLLPLLAIAASLLPATLGAAVGVPQPSGENATELAQPASTSELDSLAIGGTELRSKGKSSKSSKSSSKDKSSKKAKNKKSTKRQRRRPSSQRGIRHKYVFFEPPSGRASNGSYAIATAWTLTYPKKIKHGLEQEGLVVRNNEDSFYDWVVIEKVKKKAVTRGEIEFLNAGEVDDAEADEEVVDQARRVLESTYPTLEVGLAVGLTLGLVPLLLIVACCVLARG